LKRKTRVSTSNTGSGQNQFQNQLWQYRGPSAARSNADFVRQRRRHCGTHLETAKVSSFRTQRETVRNRNNPLTWKVIFKMLWFRQGTLLLFVVVTIGFCQQPAADPGAYVGQRIT